MERDTFGFLEGIIICEQKFLYGLVGHKLKKGKKKRKKNKRYYKYKKSYTYFIYLYSNKRR